MHCCSLLALTAAYVPRRCYVVLSLLSQPCAIAFCHLDHLFGCCAKHGYNALGVTTGLRWQAKSDCLVI